MSISKKDLAQGLDTFTEAVAPLIEDGTCQALFAFAISSTDDEDTHNISSTLAGSIGDLLHTLRSLLETLYHKDPDILVPLFMAMVSKAHDLTDAEPKDAKEVVDEALAKLQKKTLH